MCVKRIKKKCIVSIYYSITMDTIQGIDPQYFITITFKSVPHAKPSLQLGYTLPIIANAIGKSALYVLVPELTISGQIHYHGLVSITDKIKWYKKSLPSLKINCGHILIKKYDSLEKIYNYITKDINNNKIIFKQDNLFITNKTKIQNKYTPTTLSEIIINLEN